MPFPPPKLASEPTQLVTGVITHSGTQRPEERVSAQRQHVTSVLRGILAQINKSLADEKSALENFEKLLNMFQRGARAIQALKDEVESAKRGDASKGW